jgi:hypothetical protein
LIFGAGGGLDLFVLDKLRQRSWRFFSTSFFTAKQNHCHHKVFSQATPSLFLGTAIAKGELPL